MRLKINNAFPIVLLILFTAASGCTQKLNKEAEAPADLIPRDTMVSIFVDLRLMDAIVTYEQRQGNRKINDMKYYFHNSIMTKYGITREQFESSFEYYQSDLDVIDEIYAEAITRLSMIKTQIQQEE